MKRVGNAESNKMYNPRNQKAQIPIDVDEVDGAMERYIRQKYEQRIYMTASAPGTRHNTGSTSSDDRPPPLPPKPSGRFGFGLRKASISRNFSPPISPNLGDDEFAQNTSPPRVNKPSRVFGSNIQTSGDGMDSKLSTLRDMGFPDEKRNSTVLKGLNGNLDRAVEALIRLGEQNAGTSRGGTPTPPAKPSANGISFDNSSGTPGGGAFANPFDALDAAPVSQQQAQQPNNGGATQQTAQANSYNPFFSQGQQGQQTQYQQQNQYQQQGQYQQQAAQQQQQQPDYSYQNNPFGQVQGQPLQVRHQSLEQSFQGMQLSAQQQQPQQLFPNRTGGLGQTPNAPFAQTNPFQQSFTPPPMPQISEQFSSFYAPQPQYQSMSSPSSPGNPFLKSSRSQIFTPTHSLNSNPFGQSLSQQAPRQQQQQQPQQSQQASNPWMQQQTQTSVSQIANPWQTHSQPYQQSQASSSQAPNPWQPQPQQQLQQQQQQQQQQPYNHGQPGFQGNPSPFDKSSILSLYNQPQAAPAAQGLPRSQTMPALGAAAAPTAPTQAPGHMNPFGAQSAQPPTQTRHVSNESVDFAGLMGGRHSPDAFSGLSASYRR
jgi:hypothetical protein